MRQARYLRDVIIEAYNYDVVFSSTSDRVLETAKYSQDFPFIDKEDLREMDFGNMSGKMIDGLSPNNLSFFKSFEILEENTKVVPILRLKLKH